MKKNKKVIFNGVFLVAVFALTIYGVFHGEDLESMMDAIRSADKRWLAPGLALVAFFIWGESIIIWYMMRSYGIKLKKRTCFLFSNCFLYSLSHFFLPPSYLVAFFFLPTVFFGPLRVLALVLVL